MCAYLLILPNGKRLTSAKNLFVILIGLLAITVIITIIMIMTMIIIINSLDVRTT